MVHHIQVWSRVLSSHFKLGDCSPTRRCMKPTERGGKTKAEALRGNVATSRLQLLHYAPAGVVRSGTRWSFKSGSCKTFVEELGTLIQYGAQLRSQFQDPNTEVSRRPISLKVAQ